MAISPESFVSFPENSRNRKFINKDNNDNQKVVFECITEDISEADKMYEEKFGIKPEKQANIACSIKKLD